MADGYPEDGRYHPFSEIKQLEYLRLIEEEGLGRVAAASAISVSRPTIDSFVKANPAFGEAREYAEIARNAQVEDALYMAGVSGNVTACQVWLYNRDPDNWKDKRSVDTHVDMKIVTQATSEIADAFLTIAQKVMPPELYEEFCVALRQYADTKTEA